MDAILLHGVKTHNLKNLDLVIPHHRFYVITGVSGSGKSSLAFDTLYAEGQRRYVESLSAYARQFLERMEKPDVESVSGIPPAIAIEAKNTIQNARSTVGTQTEINDYLRVLFARIGKTFCPDCDVEVVAAQPSTVAGLLEQSFDGEEIRILSSIPLGKGGRDELEAFLPELERQGFLDYWLDGRVVGAAEMLKTRRRFKEIEIVVDHLRPGSRMRKRLVDSLELAFRTGKGKIRVWAGGKRLTFSEDRRCPSCERLFREPTPNLFSFNSPLGACPECQGFGRVITIDWNLVVPDERKSIEEGAIEPWTKPSTAWEKKQLLAWCRKKKIPLKKPWKDLSDKVKRKILHEGDGEDFYSVQGFFNWLEKKTYKMHVRIFLAKYRGYVVCPVCAGTRLKPEGLAVRVQGRHIAAMLDLSMDRFLECLEALQMTPGEKERVEPVYVELLRRVRFLKDVGLDYLSPSRLSRTLSGGEVQRINLATSLGSALVDTLYVLDEPSIGLHERDNRLLIRLLEELRDLGNTVVVVEHDRTMIEAADEVIDLGLTGGEQGGKLLFQGPVKKITENAESLTGKYLSGQLRIQRREPRPQAPEEWIRIRGGEEHNLKKLNVDIPLGRMVVLTGVSGSGKSTLLYDILYRQYRRFRGERVQDAGAVASIRGLEKVDRVVLVDQSPIGRTPRSNPVTYIKAFDEIRKIFSRTSEARQQGLGPGAFSFNVDGGRCPSCKGDGRVKVEMHFLADVFVPCEECRGTRYKSRILDIRVRGRNIDDVLNMTVEEAVLFFQSDRALVDRLFILKRVGLGYLRLGQSATTLSGGEAQRLKLAYEMSERGAEHSLYLFDEPTTGLHYHDIHFLLEAFEELLSRRHSLILIEHNMELIRASDYVIDLGPEGGEGGGRLVYQGDLRGLMKCSKSHTGKYLKQYQAKSREPVSKRV